MAPYLTHLVVGERAWDRLGTHRPTADGGHPGDVELYGTFLFGCLAPDVDKLNADLAQSTTHFLVKDDEGTWAWQRTRFFLEHQSEFLQTSFHGLESVGQAFVLGYLCHVATDEITGRMARLLRSWASIEKRPLPHVDAILTAIDPRVWELVTDPAKVEGALDVAMIPDKVLSFAPPADLTAQYEVVVPQVAEGGGHVPAMRMIRRTWQWQRNGRVSDEQDDPNLEAELANLTDRIEADLPDAEQLIERMQMGSWVEYAVDHSLQRMLALIAAEGKT